MASKQDRSSDSVILLLTTNFPILLERVIKYLNMINHQITQEATLPLYIEAIQDGLLYVFADLDAFNKIHHPLPPVPTFLLKRHAKITKEDEKEILGQFSDAKAFPKEGVQYHLKCTTHSVELLVQPMQKYYHSMCKDIETKITDQNEITIYFRTYEGVYRNFLFSYLVTQTKDREGLENLPKADKKTE
jgi:hypothetical protein